jgi:hypothetical protein
MIELAEDERHEDITACDGGLGVGFLDGFKPGESAGVVEVVEVLVGLADLWGEVDGVGVSGGVGFCWRQVGQQKSQSEEEDFYPAFYCCFSRARVVGFGLKSACIRMTREDV